MADERVAKANSKRAIRVILYPNLSRDLPTLKNALRLHKKRRTYNVIPFWQEQTVSTSVALGNEGSAALSPTRSLRSRFFFACVHPVRLAYISSDLRTCTQRMFAGNISVIVCWIEVSDSSATVLVGCCYRPPDSLKSFYEKI